MKTVYLDHAATSWPKPPEVIREAVRSVTEAGGNPGRGSHRLSDMASELLYAAREEAADFFGGDPERTVFTSGATMSLNTAIRGLARNGCHILFDSFAHNAVYRTVCAMTASGICTADVCRVSGSDDDFLNELSAKIRWKPEWWC